MKSLCYLLITLLADASSAYCQQTWIPQNIPLTRFIQAIAVDSTDTHLLLSGDEILHIGADSSSSYIWDGSNYALLGSMEHEFFSCAYYQNYLYACGDLQLASSQGVASMAKYNGTKWEGISGSGPNGGGGGIISL